MDETTLRRLYATVPTGFVIARNDVVKELRRAKERDEAKVVAALRKPDWTDWAFNVAAGEHADAVAEFTRAASDVRDAQTAAIEGRDGPDVRAALRALRDRTTELVRDTSAALERAGRAPGAAELTARLAEIAGNALACDLLRMGLLGSSDPDLSDPFAGLEPPDRPRPRPAIKRGPAVARSEPELPAGSKPIPSAAERQRIKRDRERAERAHQVAVRDLARAEDELEQATVAVATAREKLAQSESALSALNPIS